MSISSEYEQVDKQRQTSFSGKLPPPKPKNADVRPREYLTDKEVDRLMKAASKVGRHRHRDSTLILVTYRHGFRVSELVALSWDQTELTEPNDISELFTFVGNGKGERRLFKSGSNLAFEIIFHNLTEPQVEFTFDSDVFDGIAAERFGPYAYEGKVLDEQTTRFSVSSNGGSFASGILDHWSMRELNEFEPGDFDFDGDLDVNDIDILSADARELQHSPIRDLTGDGVVNGDDRDVWVHDLRNTFFGDSNLDGEFNSEDLVAVFQASEYEDDVEGSSSWATGDWNGDAEFDSSDLVFAFQDGGYEIGPRAAVDSAPEPSGILPLILAVFLVAVSSRHRPIRSEMFG